MARPRVAFIGSGGLTKGIAHIGTIRAMEELGLHPDLFVGTSTGAVIGAFVAQGMRSEQMIDWVRPFWRRHSPSDALKARYFMGRPTAAQWRSLGWLTSGVFSIDRFERYLAEHLPKNDFRELEHPLLVTAADIDGRGRVVFGPGYRDRVPISSAVAASCCVPVLFRPHRIGGRYFIDGEAIKTLSIDLAIEAGADVVIVSSVYRPHVTRPNERSLIHGGLSAVLTQTANMMLSEKERRGVDLIAKLHPGVTVLRISADLGRYSLIGRSNARQMLTRTYREALRVLTAAKQRGVFDIRSNVRMLGKA